MVLLENKLPSKYIEAVNNKRPSIAEPVYSINLVFGPIYSHMRIKKKKWLSPAVQGFAKLVLQSIGEADEEMTASTAY